MNDRMELLTTSILFSWRVMDSIRLVSYTGDISLLKLYLLFVEFQL